MCLQQLTATDDLEVTSSNPSGKTARDQVQKEDTIYICLKEEKAIRSPIFLALCRAHSMV